MTRPANTYGSMKDVLAEAREREVDNMGLPNTGKLHEADRQRIINACRKGSESTLTK